MIAECKVGSSVRDLCILGDKKLTEETSKAYKKDKKIHKGKINIKTLSLCMMIHNYCDDVIILIA